MISMRLRSLQVINDDTRTRKPMAYRVSSGRFHGRVGKGVGHLGHDEAMEAGGREFDS